MKNQILLRVLLLSIFVMFCKFSLFAGNNGRLSGEHFAVYYISEPFAGSSNITFDGNGNGESADMEDNYSTFTYDYSKDNFFCIDEIVDEESLHWECISDVTGKYTLGYYGVPNYGSGLFMSMKKSAEQSNASLNGEFLCAYFGKGDFPFAGLFSAVFDGEGSCSYELLQGSSAIDSGNLNYLVQEDAVCLALSDGGEIAGHGIIDSSAKNIAFTAGGKGVGYGIKLSSNVSIEDMEGIYYLVEYQKIVDEGDEFESADILKTIIDENGHGTYEILSSVHGATEEGTIDFTLGENGYFTAILNNYENDKIYGVFSPETDTITCFKSIDNGTFSVIYGLRAFDETPISVEKVNPYFTNNAPNPFNPTTNIHYNLPENCQKAELRIYNVKGENIFNTDLDLKQDSFIWNGKSNNTKAIPSGVYFYKIITDTGVVLESKMTLLK